MPEFVHALQVFMRGGGGLYMSELVTDIRENKGFIFGNVASDYN